MEYFVESLSENQAQLKTLLPAEDILYYAFQTADETNCLLCYADGMVNKELLGELVAKPLSFLYLFEQRKSQNEPTVYKPSVELIRKTLRFPELKELSDFATAIKEILDGNTLLLIDGLQMGFIVGAKLLPVRAVTEPPTDVAVKGPREGFIEDIKTNMALVRKRLKSPALRMDISRVGKRSDTAVAICYLDGIAPRKVKDEITRKIEKIQIDAVPDSSYIAAFLSPKKHSVFRYIGTTEKPDVFCAKLAEGRVGVLVDGSPIALTAPYILTEDLQSSEDYFISPFMATLMRLLRTFAVLAALLLPAVYIAIQLFKMQLVPLGLMLTIASSIRELPLSPSMEMFVVLLLLEILRESSIRMPKYVGMSLSVVGGLVLGQTAVTAGFLSTPAIIIVAFSGICMYTVPAFVETGSVLRWLFLISAGSLGVFGVILFAVFILYYLLSAHSYGAPLLTPFAPFILHDLKDSAVKYDMQSLTKRPAFLHLKNQTRMRNE